MSQGVAKLKELLFDSESRALLDLQRRIEAVARVGTEQREALARDLSRLSAEEAAYRAELARQLDGVFDRAGTEERFTSSVAAVLDGALREAEVKRHSELSAAVAPLVVRTIKTEIRNSQDELVEALYPITGRMVKAYVASAMKDLSDRINRRLEANPLMLRLRALATGRSVAELALADSQRLELEELFLIRRGTGELVARWPRDDAGANRDQVMSGILTAINEFSMEAFREEGSALRRIDLGTSEVYLRASPRLLLAAKCSGVAAPAVEQVIDEQFLATIERHRSIWDADGLSVDPASAPAAMSELADNLRSAITEAETESAASGFNPLKALLWLVALLLIGWLGYGFARDYITESVRAKAAEVVAAAEPMRGYPVRIAVAPFGTEVKVEGLAPSDEARDELSSALRARLEGSRVVDALAVVPTGPDARPAVDGLKRDLGGLRRDLGGLQGDLTVLRGTLETEALERTRRRVVLRLTGLPAELSRLEDMLNEESAKAVAQRSAAAVTAALADLDAVGDLTAATAGTAGSTELFSDLHQRLDTSIARLSALLVPAGAGVAEAASARQAASFGTAIDAAEALAVKAEQLSTLTAAMLQAAAVRPEPPQPLGQTPRQQLIEFIQSHAIFFSNGTTWRDPDDANAVLDQVARLLTRTDASLRIVGYTDERGGAAQNTPLSQARAETVREALLARGIARDRLVVVGRNNARELSGTVGDGSPNRRVELEIAFSGETSQ